MLKVQFLTHATLSVETANGVLLCDPWFSGAVFNHSWGLMTPLALDAVPLNRVEYIWISHEHPDHLHFPTLKSIRENSNHKITILYRLQDNKNVIRALENLGFKTRELLPGKVTALSPDLSVTSYPNHTDTALVITAENKTILNQNDCHLPPKTARKIMSTHHRIDAWFCQFSLAGYYANPDNHGDLENARQNHINMIRKNFELFKPKTFVPFASFVYFVKKYNSYLNGWAVTPKELTRALPNLPTQVLKPLDYLLWDDWQQNNSKNICYWEDLYKSPPPPTSPHPIPKCDLETAAQNLINEARKDIRPIRPTAIYLELEDLTGYALIDFKRLHFSFVDYAPAARLAGKLPSEELLFFLKFPFGGDTLNITANFYVYNPLLWQRLLYYRHGLYIFQKGRPYKAARQWLRYQAKRLTTLLKDTITTKE